MKPKKLILDLIAVLTLCVVVYLLVSFLALDIDFTKWGVKTRVFYVLCIVIVSAMYYPIKAIIKEDFNK